MWEASLTTSNEAWGRNPHAPEGFGRRGAVCIVPAPRRWDHIDCVAAPRILPHGVPTAARVITRTGS